MQDNNIMISYKIQDVRIIKTKIIDGEYHIYGIRNNKKPGKDYRLKDYRTVKILIDVYDNMPVFLHLTKQRYICKITGKTITSSIGIVKKRCRISNRIKKRIETNKSKNYLNEKELNQMQRIVSAYLDMAELQAERNIPMTMEDWEKRLNGFLELWDSEILQDAGKVTAALAKKHAESEFEKYRIIQDKLYKSDFDKFLELEDKTDNIEK